MKTLRNAQGSRICRKCGEVLGINLGTQRRHDDEKHTPVYRFQYINRNGDNFGGSHFRKHAEEYLIRLNAGLVAQGVPPCRIVEV